MTVAVHEYAARQADLRPDATAVVAGDRTLTYGELEAASNRLARALEEAGCERGDRVCLFVPKSPEALVAMLAVLKAGAAYVPVDLASPAARVDRMVRSAEPRVLLATAAGRRLVEALLGRDGLSPPASVGWLDETGAPGEGVTSAFGPSDLAAFSPESFAPGTGPDDLAQILFTSGSTGVPKGVMITHAMIIHFVEWAVGHFGISASDRHSGHPPLHFDLSTFDRYGCFMAGAQLHLVPPELNLLPHKLADLTRDAELTQWFSVPSALNQMAKADVVREDDFPALKRLLWCGEVLPTSTLIYFMRRLTHVRFTNLYGPTETTIASSHYTVPRAPSDAAESIPIGTACDGEELLVLDERMRPTAPDEIGDLYIAGAGLSPGYWRDEEKTRAVFLSDPRAPGTGGRIYRTGDLARVNGAGSVDFLGRSDSQIKSRGYRIELGEVESALDTLPGLREVAAVGVASEGFDGTAICCAYAVEPGSQREPSALRRELGALLPSYMVPSRWMTLDALPKNANGKLDRPRIRELFQQAPAR